MARADVNTRAAVPGAMHVRPETTADRAGVRALNIAAFDTPAEADLVDALRARTSPVISLVAETDAQIVGHILFSPLALPGHPDAALMALAPMAVTPAHQRTGIGTALVRAGIEQCRRLGGAGVIVLGHPDYYPRFGFLPASRFGITSDYDVPDNVFMALELQPDALRHKAGRVIYAAPFNDPWKPPHETRRT